MSKLKGKKDIKMTIFIIVVGVSLIVAGIYGIVSSRVESRDYKNTTDIRKPVSYTHLTLPTILRV